MKPHQPESDEKRARKILQALEALEKRRFQRRFSGNLLWLLTLSLILAIALLIIINIARFRTVYQLLTNPRSLLGQ